MPHDLSQAPPSLPVPISQPVGTFNLEIALAGKSSETQRKYMDWIAHFYKEVLGHQVNSFQNLPIDLFVLNVNPASVEAWLGNYAARGHSKSGLGQARAAIVFLARMLVLAKQAPSSLWHDLQLVAMPDAAASAAYGETVGEGGARWLAPQEVKMLIEAAKTHPNQIRAARDVSLIWLLVTLGLRREEAANLQWDNIVRRGNNWVLRIRGKRNKWRAVGLPEETLSAIAPWGKMLGGGGGRMPDGMLLRRVWRSGKIAHTGITGNAVWRIVTDTWKITGLVGDLAPHDLRRTAAAIALEAGAKEREIQQMLGHSSIETTHRYLAPMRENTATYRIASLLSQEDSFF